MSLKIYDKRPVIVTNGPSPIPSVQAAAEALGVSEDDIIPVYDVNHSMFMCFAYLPHIWEMTSKLDGDGQILLKDDNPIYGGLTGQKIPSSQIVRIQFYGTM